MNIYHAAVTHTQEMDMIGLTETKQKDTGSEIVGAMFISIAECLRTEELKEEFPF